MNKTNRTAAEILATLRARGRSLADEFLPDCDARALRREIEQLQTEFETAKKNEAK